MGIIARCVKYAAEKLVTLTGETVKDFNLNTLLYTPAGDDSIPLPDERLLLVKVDGSGKHVTAGVLTPSQGAKPGEKIFFARDKDGNIVSKMSFLGDGTVKLEADKDFIKRIKGDYSMDIEGESKTTVAGDASFKGKGSVNQEAAKNYEIKAPSAQITGGMLQVDGAAPPSGTGPFCGLPACLFTGAPHIGNIVNGT